MRRVFANLALFLVAWTTFAPLAVAGWNNSVPACCRQHGIHHCAMAMADMAPTPSHLPGFRAHSEDCPFGVHRGALSSSPYFGPAHILGIRSDSGLFLPPFQRTRADLRFGGSNPSRGPPAVPFS